MDTRTTNRVFLKSKRASLFFRAINYKLRQKMIEYIAEHLGTTVTALYEKLRLEQSVASQHLGILRAQGFVIAERDGKYMKYSVNQEKLQQIEQVADFLNGVSGVYPLVNKIAHIINEKTSYRHDGKEIAELIVVAISSSRQLA